MNHSPEIRWQQRFEYTLELAWKTVKDYYLEQSGVVLSAVTPRQVIKDAFAARILDDGQTWIDMIDHRNLISHAYDAAKFEEAVDAIHGRYLAAFAQVRDLLAARKNTWPEKGDSHLFPLPQPAGRSTSCCRGCVSVGRRCGCASTSLTMSVKSFACLL